MAARRFQVVGMMVAAAVGFGALTGCGTIPQAGGSVVNRGSSAPATSSTPSATSTPIIASPAPTTTPKSSLAPVLQPVTTAADSNPAAIAAKIASAGSLKLKKSQGAGISAAVMSAKTGKLLYASDGSTGLIPASTTKLLTTSAALKLLGPQHRFRTSVVNASFTAKGATTHQIDLVGGGDPYLTETKAEATVPGQASLQALAASTAKRLKADKITTVRLGYDASLFPGPSWNPTWPAGYSTSVTATSALWANEGQLYGAEGPRQPDPPQSAADEFATFLRKDGIKITKINAAKAPAGATEVAGLDSLPLSKIIEKLLMVSDNDAAEVLARQVAIAEGEPGTITNAVNSIKKVITGLGAWTPGTRMYDGSGLSRDGRIPAETFVKVLRLGIDGQQPNLGPIFTGLPVAGVEGSLEFRLDESDATVGRGIVRAKTGTLTDVRSLAGYAYTRDGELLIFAFVVNDAQNDLDAVAWLDRVSAAVASCGCKS